MPKRSAKPKPTTSDDQPTGPFLHEKHTAVLFRRKDSKWKWAEGGTLQRYPKLGEMVIVAYNKKQFTYTKPITEVISIDDSEPNSIQVVFMDCNEVWMLELPAHVNDITAIKKSLEKI